MVLVLNVNECMNFTCKPQTKKINKILLDNVQKQNKTKIQFFFYFSSPSKSQMSLETAVNDVFVFI